MPEPINIRPVDGGASVAASPGSFLAGRFAAYIDATKKCGARYRKTDKAQVCPLRMLGDLVSALEGAGFQPVVSPELKTEVERTLRESRGAVSDAVRRMDDIQAELAKRGEALYPYQVEGVRWLAGRQASLLADEMGLGKTVQALVSLPAGVRGVVICPASMKRVWEKECRRWRPDLEPCVIAGRKSFRWPAAGELLITNWDILPWTPAQCDKWDARQKQRIVDGKKPGRDDRHVVTDPPAGVFLIADEAHKAKSPKAGRTERFRLLVKRCLRARGRVVEMTGTPLLNRPDELWCLLQNVGLANDVFGSWQRFVRMFQGAKKYFGGYEWGRPVPEVADHLRRAMLRRRRADVLPDLPSKRIEFLPVNGIAAKDRKLLDAVLESVRAKLSAKGVDFDAAEAETVRVALAGGAAFEEMSRARACLATAKIPALLEFVEEYEEAGEPVLVWSAHRAPVDLFDDREGWATITGSTPNDARAEIQDRFQAGELRGLALTIQAGGEGLTLTRAAHAIFVDRRWTPSENSQAEDRLVRIGQTRGVLVKVLVAVHPIDERLAELLSEKQCIIDGAIEASAVQVGEVPRAGADLELVLERISEPVYSIPVPVKTSRRRSESAAELWAESALVTLTGLDRDRATIRNDMGWNQCDGRIGRSLSLQLGRGLTSKQWALAVRVCRKYWRQVGKCPGGAA